MDPNLPNPYHGAQLSTPTAAGAKAPLPRTPGGQQAPMMPLPGAIPPPTSSPVTHPVTPSAEDSDLIEKQWVERAKAIVDQTRNNPYLQNKEINKIKAEYVKKRYNKEIKASED